MYKESEPLSDLASAFERDGGAEPLEVWLVFLGESMVTYLADINCSSTCCRFACPPTA